MILQSEQNLTVQFIPYLVPSSIDHPIQATNRTPNTLALSTIGMLSPPILNIGSVSFSITVKRGNWPWRPQKVGARTRKNIYICRSKIEMLIQVIM